MGCNFNKGRHEKDLSVSLEEINVQIQPVLEFKSPDMRHNKQRKNNKERKKRHKSHRSKLKDSVNSQDKEIKKQRRIVSKSRVNNCVIAKYTIKDLIGKGTFSRVFRVEHRITKRPYAMKVIEAQNKKQVFEAELAVFQRLNHPNIIKLIEVLETNNHICMVMELATGGNLLDRLESKGFLSEENARSVIIMVLKGIEYLHDLGITHRDLRADNLLYYHPGNDSKIMISDFGLANAQKSTGDNYMYTICGTPQYMAPEVLSLKPYTNAVDMWAVGVITYMTLCTDFPFAAKQDIQICKLILKGTINIDNSVWKQRSRESKLFVLQLLQTDPSLRLTATQALTHDWIASFHLTYSSSSSPGSSNQSSSVSGNSSKCSTNSISSLRSSQKRIHRPFLEQLASDPEVANFMKYKSNRT